MRKTARILALFFVMTLLFSFCMTVSSSDNDPRFDTYVNMGQKAVENEYAIPHLFRQDGVYSAMQKFPLVVQNGVEYVPLSVFILYPNVEVNYSRTDDNFFLLNTKNNHYISFNVSEGIASTYDGDLLKMPTKIFNKTRYVPARTVAVVLGFTCETYDDKENGVYAFRVSDGRSSKTIEDLLAPYLEMYLPKKDEVTTPPEIITPPPVAEPDDPLEKLSGRSVRICFSGLSYNDMDRVMYTLDAYRIKASFSFSENDIISNPALLRRIYVSGHGLFVTSSALGSTPEEYAESFVSGLEKANNAMKFVIKKKTRICTLPFDMPEDIKQSEKFTSYVENAGYVIFTPNTDTKDGPTYTGSAYAVSGKIKNKITDGFDDEKPADVTALVWCSDKTQYYIADVANLVNKYSQFVFSEMDEAFCKNN